MLEYSLSQFIEKIKVSTNKIHSQTNVGINQIKNKDEFFLIKVAKKFCLVQKNTINTWDVNI